MFSLHRRKAWQGSIIEASAWNFNLSDLEYRGTVVLPSNSSAPCIALAQFIDDGLGFIYWTSNTICKVPLSTPYDLMTADLTAVPTSTYAVSDYSSGMILGTACPTATVGNAQFSSDGRVLYIYTGSAFFSVLLDVPFYPFNKTDDSSHTKDYIPLAPSLSISDSCCSQFSPNGLNFYTAFNESSRRIMRHYSLSEPFDVSTFSLASRSVSLWDIPRDDSSSGGFGTFAFSPDGLRLLSAGAYYQGGTSSSRIRMWSLREPWDIGTIFHVNTVLLPTQQTSNIVRIFVDPTASFLYCHVGSGRLAQYAIHQS